MTSLLRSGRLSHAFFFLSDGEEEDDELVWNTLLMDSVMNVRAAAQVDRSGGCCCCVGDWMLQDGTYQ